MFVKCDTPDITSSGGSMTTFKSSIWSKSLASVGCLFGRFFGCASMCLGSWFLLCFSLAVFISFTSAAVGQSKHGYLESLWHVIMCSLHFPAFSSRWKPASVKTLWTICARLEICLPRMWVVYYFEWLFRICAVLLFQMMFQSSSIFPFSLQCAVSQWFDLVYSPAPVVTAKIISRYRMGLIRQDQWARDPMVFLCLPGSGGLLEWF